MRPRKFTLLSMSALVLPVLFTLAYNLYIDPFQIFHKDFEKPEIILGGRGTDRYQQAGIINQYRIRSAIIGNSHSANYLPSDLAALLGWQDVYTLTMDGGTLREQAVVARYALSKHCMENVLWGLAVPALQRPWKVLNKKLPLKEYLYDPNRLNDLRFFLTFDLQKYHRQKQARRKQILASPYKKELARKEFDLATSWYPRAQCSFDRPAFVAEKILKEKARQYFQELGNGNKLPQFNSILKTPASQAARNYQENLAHNLLPIITGYPCTHFIFVLTAYPTLKMQKNRLFRPKQYTGYLQTLRRFVLDMARHDNVKVFGFDLERFPEDLRLYKDPDHYHIAVNKYILTRIAQGNNLLTPDNIDNYLAAFDLKVASYRLPKHWIPHPSGKNRRIGYLSEDVAEKLIIKEILSDQEVISLSLEEKNLPKCAQRIIKTVH